MATIGPILVIIIVGVIYYIFTNFDSKQADKATDRHVKKTMADVELEKLRTTQEELRLKKEYFEFSKAQLLEQQNPKTNHTSKSGVASYKIKDEQLDDKSKKSV